jgi:pyrroloquinoline quinone biosynthesis protein E
MLISETEFRDKYGQEFDRLYARFNEFTKNPAKLKTEIKASPPTSDTVVFSKKKLRTPSPDPFAQRLVQYRGFVEFPKRLKNFIISKHAQKTSVLQFIPTRVDFEPNARCNSRCIMCQVSTWPNMKRSEDVSLVDFKSFIDEQYGLMEVKLHGMGEPLMHNDFFDLVKYLRDRHIWVRTNTNCTLLHLKDNYKRLIDSDINEVQMSFDGATKEVFEHIRNGSPFERVVDNMTLTNDYANSKNILVTRMWSTIQENNVHQILDLYEMGKKMGFRRITFAVGLGDWGQEKMRETNQPLQIRKFLSDNKIEALERKSVADGIDLTFWNLVSSYSTKSIDTACRWPFSWTYISADMRAVPCGMIGNPDVAEYGDAKSFLDTWNGQAYQDFRQAHLDGDIPDYCKNCYSE